MQFRFVLVLILALSNIVCGQTVELFEVSINMTAPAVPTDPMNRLAELIKTHPDKQLLREFPMRLAQGQFMILWKDGVVPKQGNAFHAAMSIRIRDLKDNRTGQTKKHLVLNIFSSFIMDPALSDQLKQSALRHEWEHLLERFEYGPPSWMSQAEQETSPDVMTIALVLQKFKGELRAYMAEMKMNTAAGWKLDWEPYKTYRKDGELGLRDWLGRVIKSDPEYAPFEELLHGLVTDGILVPFHK